MSASGVPFFAQNGGNAWATTFDLGPGGVLINLARLDSVTFNAAKTEAIIGGGASINKTITAVYQAGALVETGNCNCVSTLGTILGGGYGNLMGKYGFGVDNVISPSNSPVILVNPFLYKGTPTTGHEKLASLFAIGPIGPIADATQVIPYTQWNSGSNGLCSRGPRKPAYSARIQTLIPSVWRQVWDEFVAFQSRPGAESSAVLVETYSPAKARTSSPPPVGLVSV